MSNKNYHMNNLPDFFALRLGLQQDHRPAKPKTPVPLEVVSVFGGIIRIFLGLQEGGALNVDVDVRSD